MRSASGTTSACATPTTTFWRSSARRTTCMERTPSRTSRFVCNWPLDNPLSDHLNWRLVPQKAGNYVTSKRTTSFWPIRRLKLFCTAGNAHMQCLMWQAFPHLPGIERHFKCSVDTLILWSHHTTPHSFCMVTCMSNKQTNKQTNKFYLLQGHRPMQNIIQHIDKLTHVRKWANVHLLHFVISLYK